MTRNRKSGAYIRQISARQILSLVLILGPLALLSNCGPSYDPIDFTVEGNKIIARGEIGPAAVDKFAALLIDNPQVDTLVLAYIGGSVDDETNLVLSRLVREAGLTTIVPGDGMVASGGTDLFLAGQKRLLAPGACVGVHSWADEDREGADVPTSDPVHEEYLSYFREVGVPEAFYWYTLEVASADDMHWMSAAETAQFAMTTTKAPRLSDGEVCDNR